MYEHEPGYEDSESAACNTFGDVGVGLYGIAVGVEFDVEPPEECAAVEGGATHENVEQDAGDVAVLAEGVGGVEGAEDVGGAEVEG